MLNKMEIMKKLSLLFCGISLSFASFAQPANDNCAGAQVITPNGSCQNGTNVGANDSWSGDVGCATAGNANQHLDVWYSFVATGGVFDITATSATLGNIEIILAQPGATACVDAFTVLSSFCGASPVVGSYSGLAVGNTYYYTVSSNGNNTGTFQTCVNNTALANNDCSSAVPVTVGAGGVCVEVTGTNIGATDSGVTDPSCSSYAGGDVWFSAVVPASGNVTFASDYADANSLTDIGMAVYTGPCGSLTEIYCDDDSGNGLMSSISASGLTPGSTVYIRVWEFGNDEIGDFDLCFSEPPVSDSNQDCESSTGLCTSATLAGASDGEGNIIDLNATNQDCLSTEHESSWFDLEIATAGTFEFTLSPSNGSDDYDFAVWVYPGGAGQACPPTVAPDRCSFAAGSGLNGSYDTGLGSGAVDPSEDASGDNWVSTLNLNVGDVIVILIDNFSSTTSPFTVDFPGTAGLDCTVLPVELLSFYAEAMADGNRLHWKTESEMNNDYFTVEHSKDAENWRVIGTVNGAGTTNDLQRYSLDHDNVDGGVNYYKLYQTDTDGTVSNVRIISINNDKVVKVLVNTINLIGQEVDTNYKGVVIDLYNDGTSIKRLQ